MGGGGWGVGGSSSSSSSEREREGMSFILADMPVLLRLGTETHKKIRRVAIKSYHPLRGTYS